MSKIIKIILLGAKRDTEFLSLLDSKVAEFQNADELEVEIHYADNGNGFSALVIGREKEEVWESYGEEE